VVEDNGVSKVHGVRLKVRDREDVPDLGSGSTVKILAENNRGLLVVRGLTQKHTEVIKDIANLGSLLQRGNTTQNEVISKKKGMDERATKTKGDTRKVRVEQFLIETNGKFINCYNKKIGREGAALADATLGGEGSSRLTINKDREGRCNNSGFCAT
jgi:hypothetical protein